MNEALIQTEDLSLQRQGRRILDNVNIEVQQGEIVTLIGPNGAGKSSLVRIILGLLKPDQGQVKISANTRIGYMPQKLHIDPVLPLSVRRFLTLTQRTSEKKLYEVLTEVGAEKLIDSALQNLSGGETQRVLLARAMLRNPDLLILDEPVQGVDVVGQEDLYRLIGTIRQRHNCGILMVSHDLHLVMSATDRVVCLNQHVCCSGHPDTVRADPSYIALFGQTPVLMPYSHHHDHSHDSHGNVIPNKQDEDKECHHG